MGRCLFSSRRRHTRYWRDWSSDVCSSDLEPALLEEERRLFYVGITRAERKLYITHARSRRRNGETMPSLPSSFLRPIPRSEERRVGEECRSRWSPYHLKK